MGRSGSGAGVERLRADIGNLTDELMNILGERTDDAANDVKERLQRIRNQIEELTSEMSSRGRELAEQVNFDELTSVVGDTVRERPMTMVAMAAGLGMLIASQPWSVRGAAPSGEPERWRSGPRDWRRQGASGSVWNRG